MKEINKNYIKVSGIITGLVEFSHEIKNEKFYKMFISVKRKSDTRDIIPVIISEKLIPDGVEEWYATLIGEIRTYNKINNNKTKLELYIFVKEIIENKVEVNENIVEINGYICKEPIYRKTPAGIEICDLLVAVNRKYNKSNYIPTICWNKNAKIASELTVGSKINLTGMFQSRYYNKNDEIKTAYELSVQSINTENNTSVDDFIILEDVE